MSSDDRDIGAKAITSLIMLGLYLVGSCTYNQFATTNKEITNQTITEKHTSKRLVSYKSGKRRKFRIETDYHMKTADGHEIMDEPEIWEKKFDEGQIYAKVQEGKAYDFYVNHDDLLNKDNALKFKLAGMPQYDQQALYKTIEKYNPVEKPRAAEMTVG
jgi:hypothetical protein